MLTGESVPVHKQINDKLYMGCAVTSGRGEALVTATGMNTEMGKIAHLVNETQEQPTQLQLKLRTLGKFIAIGCVTICLAVGFLGYLQGNDFLEMLLTGISLAVAAIPEGLPAIVTITLALSVGRILRKGAVIRKLHAVETLGCAGVICSDKTGTITQNKMTVRQIYVDGHDIEVSGDGYSAIGKFIEKNRFLQLKNNEPYKSMFTAAVLCNTATVQRNNNIYKVSGDPTETALLVAAGKAGYTKEDLTEWKITSENPFDSRRKMMSVIAHTRHKSKLFCKGAPDILLEHCTNILSGGMVRPITREDKEHLSHIIRTMADKALRVLGFAESEAPENGETQLTFIGLMAMLDPPRAEVRAAVRRCRAAGIRPVMITGDYRATAIAIAREVGIYRQGDNILDGAELEEMSDSQLASVCMRTAIFARVGPAHKLRIVRAYKAAGQVVAMTGDGVNDAPAVKEADIGVAMGLGGTDVTKEASGVVIMDDNFATIVSAVEEGRVIYQNIRRFIRFLLTSNLGEVLGMLFGMLAQLPVSLLPIQILLVNLFTDGLPAVALGMEPPSKDIMNKKPRPKTESLFAGGLMRTIIIRGIMLGIASSGAYYIVLQLGGELTVARSACFLTIVLSQMLHIFECRGEGLHFGSNIWLLLAVAASVLSAIGSVYLPIAQKAFGTASVNGIYFVIVIAAVISGPVIMAALRLIKKILKG
ncbi:MAG: cation-translocating P-type ATPase, partial [Oscillospiraceae bacterium]